MKGARRILWIGGAPARAALIGLIRLYQLTLSGWLGGQCRFSPSCSAYAIQAVRFHGALRGSMLAGWRLVRCGPFTAGGFDPVPERWMRRGPYDDVIQSGRA